MQTTNFFSNKTKNTRKMTHYPTQSSRVQAGQQTIAENDNFHNEPRQNN